MPRGGAGGMPGLHGLVNFLKPPGMTSHDAVDFARRLFNLRRIGHGGTLDPGAAGVLPLFLGRATRLAGLVQSLPKVYRAEMTLGVRTDTYDQFGNTTSVVADFSLPLEAVREAFDAFTGVYWQVPPMTSARRHQGRRLYDLAREGQVVAREARPVTITRLDIVRIVPGSGGRLTFGARVFFDVECSSGTYVRSLCHDIGERLGCGAHMSFLIRTAVGPLTIGDALTVEQLESLVAEGRAVEAVLSPDAGLSHLPAVQLEEEGARRFQQGQAVPWGGAPAGRGPGHGEVTRGAQGGPGRGALVRVHGPGGRFLGLAYVQDGPGAGRQLRPYRVLAPGDGSGP